MLKITSMHDYSENEKWYGHMVYNRSFYLRIKVAPPPLVYIILFEN